MTVRNIFLIGASMLTAAAAIEGGFTAALIVGGISTLAMAFGVAVSEI